MDPANTLQSLGLGLPSPAYIFGAVSQTWLLYGVGAALCAGLFLDRG